MSRLIKRKAGIIDIISVFCAVIYGGIVVSIIFNPSHPNLLQLQDKMNPIMLAILAGYFGENITDLAMPASRVSKKFKDIEIGDDESLSGYGNDYIIGGESDGE